MFPDQRKKPLLTSHVFKMCVDFVSTPCWEKPTHQRQNPPPQRLQPPVVAFCSQRFHSALPPLLICTQDYLLLSDFLVFNSTTPLCRSPTCVFVFSLSLVLQCNRDDVPADDDPVLQLADNLRAAPLPYLSTIFLILEAPSAAPYETLWAALRPSSRLRSLWLKVSSYLGWTPSPLGAATPAFMRGVNAAFPVLEEMRLPNFVIERGAMQRPADEEGRSWFSKLRLLHDATWQDVTDAFQVAQQQQPQLYDLMLGVSELSTAVEPEEMAFPKTSSLKFVQCFLRGARNVKRLDLGGLPDTLQAFGNLSFEDFTGVFSSSDNVAASSSSSSFCGYFDGVLDLTKFDAVREIRAHFCSCSRGIRQLRMPREVLSVGHSFLSLCRSGDLETIDFPNIERVESLDTTAFISCSALRKLDFFASVRPSAICGEIDGGVLRRNVLGNDFLMGCEALKTIDLRALAGIPEIGGRVMMDCVNLEKILNFATAMRCVKKIGFMFMSRMDMSWRAGHRQFPAIEELCDCSLADAFVELEYLGYSSFTVSDQHPKVDLRALPKLRVVECFLRDDDARLLLAPSVEKRRVEGQARRADR